MYKRKVYQAIAETLYAIENCKNYHNENWIEKHIASLEHIVETYLPNTAGFDSTLNLEKSNPERLHIDIDYHVMCEYGYSLRWVSYRIIVTASLSYGFQVRAVGRDYHDTKEYIAESISEDLNKEIQE